MASLEFTSHHLESMLAGGNMENIEIELDADLPVCFDENLFDAVPDVADDLESVSVGEEAVSNGGNNFSEHINLLSVFGFPYFRNSMGQGPPPVSHSVQMSQWGYRNVSYVRNTPFSSIEEDRIRVGVQEATNGTSININWTAVWSSQSFQSTRTPDELSRHWNHSLQPDVTYGSWTTEENRKLVQLVRCYEEQKKDVNWPQVTSDFNAATGGNRTVFQCFKRYRSRYSNHRIVHWSDEDNATFLNFIGERNLTKKELLPWRIIRSYFPGRSWSAIYSHFNYHFSPPQQRGVKFDRSDDRLLLHAITSGLQDKELEILFGYQRSITQIRNRIKTLRKNVSSESTQAIVAKTKNDQMGLQLIELIKSVQGQDANQETIDSIYSAATRHSNRKRHGRPRKAKLTMEDELRPMVRPLTFITNKRPRKNCFPGDGREHGLILTCLYRFLNCRFDSTLVPAMEERTEERLLELGVEKADHGCFTNLLDLVEDLPPTQPNLDIPLRSFEERKSKFLPPTLTTFAGTRGLLLYTPALEMQAAGETTTFDESGRVAEVSPCIETEENLGDADADELLLYRLMVLFYWPEKALQQELQVADVPENSPTQEQDVAVEPPPKKKTKRSYKKK